eukprot:XP_003730359.2 PREDICTED: uncharacterized protein LOC100893300 [Strongylocentrotus purpuratus]
MSIQDVKSFFKERFGKPFRNRRKLGEDEDDCCDALEHLSVDSDSDSDVDEEYVDASEQYFDEREQQITSKSLPTEKNGKKSPESSPRHSNSGDFQFGPKDSSTSFPKDIEPYHLGDGGSKSATSSSSEADAQFGLTWSKTIDDPPQAHPMKVYTGFVKHPPDGDTPAIEINPEQPATTDDKSGKVCQEENQLSDKSSGWFGRLGKWFLGFDLFGWLPWLLSKVWPTRIPSIYICTSSSTRSIHWLKKKLQTSSDSSRCVVLELELPFNRLEDFQFPSEVNRTDAMILCHSVHNRGFSITDVQNSIYDEFLKNCNQVFGRDHMVVVVHDFPFMKEALKGQMETFQSMQPTTFKMAGLVVLAGKLDDTEVQLCQDDLTQLEKFVNKFC